MSKTLDQRKETVRVFIAQLRQEIASGAVEANSDTLLRWASQMNHLEEQWNNLIFSTGEGK